MSHNSPSVHMPSQYFGKNSTKFHEANSPSLIMGEHAYGKSSPTSHGVNLGNNTMGPDLAAYEPYATHHSGMQTGGNTKNTGFHEANSPSLIMGEHAYGKSSPTSHGVNLGNNTMGPDLAAYEPYATHHSGMQTGGAFTKIVNPKTGRMVSIYGKTGKKILNNYVNYLNTSYGGSLSNHTFGKNPEEDEEYLEQHENTVRILSVVGNELSHIYIDTGSGDKIEAICNEIARINNISDVESIQLYEVRTGGNATRRLQKNHVLSQYEIPESSTLVARRHLRGGPGKNN